MSVPEDTEALTRALRIDMADLEANRAGELGVRQRARLKRLRTKGLISDIITIGIVIVLGYVIVWELDGWWNSPICTVCVGWFVLVPILTEFKGEVSHFDRDLISGRVEWVSGITHKIDFVIASKQVAKEMGGGWQRNVIEVADKRFPLPDKVYRAFEDNVSYTVYYASRSRVVVGAECTDSEINHSKMS